MSNDMFTRITSNMPAKIRAVKTQHYGKLIAAGWSSVAARAEAEIRTRKHYANLLAKFEQDHPIEAIYARRIARKHIKGL